MDLLKAFDRPIAFHPVFVKLTGSVNAALMLSQAVYWHSRTKDAEGWFYKTQAEWEEETCLSRREQEKAREKLRATSFWEEDLRGVPAKLHFRIDSEMFNKAVLDITNNSDEACQTSMHQTAILDCTKPPYKTAPNRHTIYKEAETTTETTTERESPPADTPVSIYQEVFGEGVPIFQQEALEAANISDMKLWREVVTAWRTNGYSKRNFTGLINSYQERTNRQAKGTDYETKRKQAAEYCHKLVTNPIDIPSERESSIGRGNVWKGNPSERPDQFIKPRTFADVFEDARRARDGQPSESVV